MCLREYIELSVRADSNKHNFSPMQLARFTVRSTALDYERTSATHACQDLAFLVTGIICRQQIFLAYWSVHESAPIAKEMLSPDAIVRALASVP